MICVSQFDKEIQKSQLITNKYDEFLIICNTLNIKKQYQKKHNGYYKAFLDENQYKKIINIPKIKLCKDGNLEGSFKDYELQLNNK